MTGKDPHEEKSISLEASETRSGDSVETAAVRLAASLRDHRLWLESGGKLARRLKAGDCPPKMFTNADLTGATLRDADFRDANLNGAIFKNAHLAGVDFREANMRECDLRDADGLLPGRLAGADLTGAKLPKE